MNKFKHLLLTLLCLVTPVISCAQTNTPNPPNLVLDSELEGDLLSLPLVRADDDILSFVGTYQLPAALVDDDGRAGGGYAMSQDGNYMYVTSFYGNIAKYRIPILNDFASLEFGWTATPGRIPADSGIHGALVEYNGELYKTKYAEYVVHGETKWIQRGSVDGDNFSGLFRISGVDNARRLAQGFMHIPELWRSTLGGPVAVLGSRLSIISNAQNGYGFAVFNPGNIGTDNSVKPLLDYPFISPLEPGSPSYPGYREYPKNSIGGTDLFSHTNAPLAGAMIVPGSRSLLFITTHGYGPSAGSGSRCRQGSSVSNDPYRLQVVAYDLKDLVHVKNGALNPYDVKPYEWWEWNSGGVHWADCVGKVPLMPGFGVYDPVNNRWYMDAHIQDRNVYVWEVNSL